ncbi:MULTISPECIES: hypothetical protein [Mesorhizobium]|uniref:hypothetical protein n=1 Tax=Mesorhizobium TaxID=68287 RepID=UPI00131520FC|nr:MULTISPECIES: hypothetical protein [Mesorhizobium]
MIPADALVPIPDAIDDRTAAAVMMQGLNCQPFRDGVLSVQPGDITLAHAS